MQFLYLACLLVALGMLFWLKIFDVRNSVTQFINLLVIVVCNLGFFFLSISTDLGEAIIAQKMAYVGATFMPLFFFLMVLEICHIKINKILSAVLVLIQCVLYGFVCTIGKNNLFYSNVSLKITNGTATIVRDYGPLHILNPITMFIYLGAAIAVIVYTLIKKKNINRRGTIALIVLSVLAVGSYVFEKVIDLEYEIIPMAFVILMMGALIPIYKHNIYTVYEKEDIINEQLGKVGFISFDKNLAYQGCNKCFAGVFPEISKYHIGNKLDGCSSELQEIIEQIVQFNEFHDGSSKKHAHIPLESFWLNDRCYEGTIHSITNTFGFLKGFAVELKDNTADRMVIKLKEQYNEELAKDVEEKTKRIYRIQQKTILGMAQMVESRDLSTGGHIKRTSHVVRIFAKKLIASNYDVDEKFMKLVIRSAPMHDLGKIGVDDAVLRKQGKFTDEEYAKMKEHSEIGYRMVKEILEGVEEPDFVRVAENVAHYHHEKVNGTGYPHGLKGDEIPVEARIMALADVFDALVSKRCYKDAFTYDKAFEIIEHDSGTHFDAELAKIFISCRPELEEYYNRTRE